MQTQWNQIHWCCQDYIWYICISIWWDKAQNKWLVIDARLSPYLSAYLLVASAQRGEMYWMAAVEIDSTLQATIFSTYIIHYLYYSHYGPINTWPMNWIRYNLNWLNTARNIIFHIHYFYNSHYRPINTWPMHTIQFKLTQHFEQQHFPNIFPAVYLSFINIYPIHAINVKCDTMTLKGDGHSYC